MVTPSPAAPPARRSTAAPPRPLPVALTSLPSQIADPKSASFRMLRESGRTLSWFTSRWRTGGGGSAWRRRGAVWRNGRPQAQRGAVGDEVKEGAVIAELEDKGERPKFWNIIEREWIFGSVKWDLSLTWHMSVIGEPWLRWRGRAGLPNILSLNYAQYLSRTTSLCGKYYQIVQAKALWLKEVCLSIVYILTKYVATCFQILSISKRNVAVSSW